MLPISSTKILRPDLTCNMSNRGEVHRSSQDHIIATSISFDLHGLFHQLQELDGENLVGGFSSDDDIDDVNPPTTSPEIFEYLSMKNQLVISSARQEQREILMMRIFFSIVNVDYRELSDILSGGEDSKAKSMFLACLQFVVGLKVTGHNARCTKQMVCDFAYTLPDSINTEIFGKGPIYLVGINLKYTNFVGINGENAVFTGSNLTGVTFENSNLKYAKFIDVNLTDAHFINTNLDHADFVDSTIASTSFAGLKLRYVKFEESSMPDADFSGANIDHVDVIKSELRRSKFCGSTIKNLNLSTVNMRGTNFKGATIEWNDWRNIDFSAANFNGVNLGQIRVRGANLYKADLTGTGLNRENLRGAVWKESNLSDLGEQYSSPRTNPVSEFGHLERSATQNQPPLDTQPAESDTGLIVTALPSFNVQPEPVFPGRRNNAPTSNVVTLKPKSDRSPLALSSTPTESISPTGTTNPVPVPHRHPLEHDQPLPAAPESVWGWLSGIAASIRKFFRQLYWRLWSST